MIVFYQLFLWWVWTGNASMISYVRRNSICKVKWDFHTLCDYTLLADSFLILIIIFLLEHQLYKQPQIKIASMLWSHYTLEYYGFAFPLRINLLIWISICVSIFYKLQVPETTFYSRNCYFPHIIYHILINKTKIHRRSHGSLYNIFVTSPSSFGNRIDICVNSVPKVCSFLVQLIMSGLR